MICQQGPPVSQIYLNSGMPARGEELYVFRWADTAAVQRNIFICQARVLLALSLNKASQNSNNSFIIVRVPCPTVETCFFLYLAYIRSFSDFLSWQLKLVNAIASTNPHLFTAYNTPVSCFSSAACSKILQQSTPECPILLHLQIYRQIAVAKLQPDLIEQYLQISKVWHQFLDIAKKHGPSQSRL